MVPNGLKYQEKHGKHLVTEKRKKTENGHSRCVCADVVERVLKFDLNFYYKHENKEKIELLVRYHCSKPMKPSEKFKRHHRQEFKASTLQNEPEIAVVVGRRAVLDEGHLRT